MVTLSFFISLGVRDWPRTPRLIKKILNICTLFLIAPSAIIPYTETFGSSPFCVQKNRQNRICFRNTIISQGGTGMSRNAIDVMGEPKTIFNWISGEMVVIVRLPKRPPDDELDTLVEQVCKQLNVILQPRDLTLELYGNHGRWLDESYAMPPVRRRAFIFGLHRQQPLVAIFFHARHADPAVDDPAPMPLSYLQAQLERLAQAGLYLVSAMPNWLVTAAPVLYGEGGPALPPRPAPTLDLLAAGNSPVGWRVSFADRSMPLDPNGAQGGLVTVLDTASHPGNFERIAKRPEFNR